MKRIPFSQVLKTAAIDIRREYDRLYGMFCVQKFQDMVGAGSSLKDYCATYFVRLPFRGTCVSLDDFDDFYGYSFEKNPSTFDIEYLVSFVSIHIISPSTIKYHLWRWYSRNW